MNLIKGEEAISGTIILKFDGGPGKLFVLGKLVNTLSHGCVDGISKSIKSSLNFHFDQKFKAIVLLPPQYLSKYDPSFLCLSLPITLRLRHLRKLDRQMNIHQYPLLTFPEVYVLHLGYKEFFRNHPVSIAYQKFSAGFTMLTKVAEN